MKKEFQHSDKKLNESKVAADAAKRFKMLCEYTFNITEDDGEEDAPQEGQEAPMGGEQMPPEGDMGQGGDMTSPEQEGQGAPMGGEQTPSEGGMEQGGAPGFNPEPDMNDDMGGGTEPMQVDDEVIDVDELTQAQEETEEKIDDVEVSMEKGFKKLINVVDKLQQMIDANSANMNQIKQEIEKRNPTPIEKLNMRAANDSYPFNVSPNDYWKEKEATSNYRIGGENEPDAEQYTITQADIDNDVDFQRIAKELESQEFNQNLMHIFNLR